MGSYIEAPGQPEDPKPPKPFLSLAQIKRVEGLVAGGTVKKEPFERDLMATELEGLPWRKGPAKPEDGDAESQAAYLAILKERKAALVESLK